MTPEPARLSTGRSVEAWQLEVFDAALAFVSAAKNVREADGTNLLAAAIERDRCFHDLAYAASRECAICEPGTCPSEPGVGETCPASLSP